MIATTRSLPEQEELDYVDHVADVGTKCLKI